MAENSKSKNGIGRIIWPLFLASILLALWLAYWYLIYDRSTPAVDTPVGETAAISEPAAVSNESRENDADAGSSANADDADSAATDSAATDSASGADDADTGTADNDAPSDDSADASVGEGASSETSTEAAAEPSGAEGDNADGSNAAASDATASTASTDSFGIALNSTLIVVDAATETEDNGLRLYATASLDAPTREVYSAGEAFRLVEPGEDFDVYPVEVAGISWVRVRDENGLLGWADLSLLASE